MAFTTRAARDFNFSQAPTPAHVGPGSYKTPDLLDPTKHLKLTATPFSSTQRRVTPFAMQEKVEKHKPGPGFYHKEEVVRKRKSASTVFKSKTNRFNSKEWYTNSQSPGPGSYHQDTQWPTKPGTAPRSTAEKREANSVLFNKSITAPSIPAVNQSYGYEEGPNGELVRQKPLYEGYTGVNGDCAGPGEYEAADPREKKNPTTSMFKSRTRRDVHQIKGTPGPGHYDIERAEQNILFAHAKPAKPETSIFLSASSRDLMPPTKDSTPGPGEYGYDTSFKKIEVPDRLQSFGSTTLRPFHVPSEISQVLARPTPGPGTYDAEPKYQILKKNKPFSSTTKRFNYEQAEIPVPGPGAYDKQLVHSSFTAELEQRTKTGSYGVFGSTSRRFDQVVKSKAPGPGQYEADPNPHLIRKNDGRTFNFASKVKRELPKPHGENVQMPAVGQYDLQVAWGKKKHQQNLSFVTKSTRFKQGSPSDVPGPGQYDHETFLATANQKSFAFTESVLPKSQRFKDLRPKENPGPGAYTVDHTLLKKSYNITI